MSQKMIELLKAEHLKTLQPARELAEKVKAEGREFTDDEQATVKAALGAGEAIAGRINQMKADAKLSELLGGLGGAPERSFASGDSGPADFTPSGSGSKWARQVAGKLFARADHYGVKALTSGSVEIPAVVAPIVEIEGRPTSVLQLVGRGTLTANTFEYIRQTLRTNNAAPVADAGTKPTSAYTIADVADRARVMAHLSEAIPNRYFADLPELIHMLDSQMREDLLIALETEIISGAGSGEHFTGILTVSGTVAQAFSTDLITTTRKAKTALEATFQRPTAYVMHPNDWEDIDLLQDNEARYFYGGPATSAAPQLHGLPVVVTPAMTEGTAVLGDWSQAKLWVREQMQLDADSSGSNFTTNQTVLRVEGRYGFGVLRPAAFAEIDLTE